MSRIILIRVYQSDGCLNTDRFLCVYTCSIANQYVLVNEDLLFFFYSDVNKVIVFTLTGSSPAHGLDLFKIDADTGLILTKAFLEDTDKGCYSLDLEARNPGTNLVDTGVAKICVTDQNESPDFDQSFYNFSINENEPAGK